ncbi:hypothetical protein NO991_11880 [Pseudoalteromonas sp. DY56-GL22]|uniref:hypothetical protein n=1 Tax=Pseudoalteromonas sp. DY56-GL22 TaxID=2967126 RepID=UPI00352A6C33
MSTSIYIIPELFFKPVNDQNEWELWFDVMPFMLYPQMKNDLAGILKGTKAFSLDDINALSDEQKQQMLGAALPHEVEVRVTLGNDNGDILTRNTNKASRLQFSNSDWLEFERLNRAISDTQSWQGKQEDTRSHLTVHKAFAKAIKNDNALTYARFHAHSIAEQLEQANDEEKLAVCSRLNDTRLFGTRRILPANVKLDQHQMVLDTDTFGNNTTNIHGMLGNMLKLADSSQALDLNTANRLTIEFYLSNRATEDNVIHTIEFPGDNVEDIFSKIKAKLPNLPVQYRTLNDLNKRVYVEHVPTNLVHWPNLTGSVFGRNQESRIIDDSQDTVVDDLNLTSVAAMRLAFEKGATDLKTLPNQISVGFKAVFEGSFEVYRDFPVDNANVLMRFVPGDEDKEDFYRYLSQISQQERVFAGAELLYSTVDDAVEKKPAPICVFKGLLAWDVKTDTPLQQESVIFFGAKDYLGHVAAVVPLFQTNSNSPLKLNLTKREIGDEEENSLLYWEAAPNEVGKLPFNGPYSESEFHAVSFDNSLLQDNLQFAQPTILFKDDIKFHIAQSASHIEHVVTAKYPFNEDNPTTDDWYNAVAEDQVNHNTINVFTEMAVNGSIKVLHLNPEHEEIPKFEFKENGKNNHVFHFTYNRRPWPSLEEQAPWSQLEAIYQLAKQSRGRPINVDLEHSFGTRLPQHSLGSVSAAIDWDIVLPTQIKKKNHQPFFRIEYRPPEGNKGERFLLHFDFDYLTPVNSTDDPNDIQHERAVFQQAWLSVAEMKFAQKVMLEGNIVRFDATKYVKNSGKNNLAACLSSALGPDNFELDITQELINYLSNLTYLPTEPLEIELDASYGLSKKANAIEMFIHIERDKDCVPSGTFKPYRINNQALSVDDWYDQNGLKVKEVQNHNVKKILTKYISSLQKARDSIDGIDVEKGSAAVFNELVGNYGSGDWLVPETAVDGNKQEVFPTCIPLSFVPIDPHPKYKSKIASYIKEYFVYLDDVINVRVPVWSETYKAAAWKTHFDTMQSKQDQIATLFDSLSKRLWTLPHPYKDYSKDKVNDFVNMWKADKKIAKEIRDQIRTQLMNQPAKFKNAKAWIFHKLSHSNEQPLNPDLYELETTKIIEPINNKTKASLVTRKDSLHNISSFIKDNTVGAGGFLEYLDDESYDNDFHFTRYQLNSFEDVIDATAKERNKAYKKGMNGVPVGAPAGKVKSGIEIPSGGIVYNDKNEFDVVPKARVSLISRKPLVKPVIVFSGQLDIKNENTERFKTQPADLEKLKNGFLTEQSSSQGALLVSQYVRQIKNSSGGYEDAKRTYAEDDELFTIICEINGDEELAQGGQWSNGFTNDVFGFFWDKNIPSSGVNSVGTDNSSYNFIALFDKLEKDIGLNMHNIDDWALITSDDVLKDLTDHLSRPLDKPEDRSVLDGPLVFKLINGGVSAQHQGFDNYYRILTFRPKLSDAGSTSDSAFYMVLQIELPIWSTHSLALVQGRNVQHKKENLDLMIGRVFDPKFAFLTGPAIALDMLVSKSESAENSPPIVLSKRSWKPKELVQKLLVDELKLISAKESIWASFDLSISVFHEQQHKTQGLYFDSNTGNTSDMEIIEKTGRHPLQVVPARTTDNSWNKNVVDFLNPEHHEFQLDFQWQGDNNNQFYSIRNVRVIIQKEH